MVFLRSARYAQKSLLFCFLPAPSSFSLGGKQGRKGSKQTALTGSGFWPMLSKPAIAIGKHASVPGKYWNGFSKGGKATAAELHQDDLGLLDPSGDSEGYLVQAASGAIEL